MACYEIKTPILETHNILGEGPLWHIEEHRLYWLDINGCLLQIFAPHTREYQRFDLGQRCGAFAFRRNGGLLVAAERGLAYWDEINGLGEMLIEFYPAGAPQLMNDGKVDPYGRFWIGSKGPPGQANLFCVESDLSWRPVLEGVTISNGLDWSPDQQWMYYIDSYTQTVIKYKYDVQSGEAKEPELVYRSEEGTPDGLSVDSSGALWVAFWDGAKLLRLSPEGQVLDDVRMPVSRPTSLCLGGPELCDMYITSASVGLDKDQLHSQHHAGGLFRLSVDTPGRPCNFFDG